MSMNNDKEDAQSHVMIRLTERQEIILKEAKNATGVSFGSLIRKCIDMNVEYLRRLTINAKEKD
ncbi:MAG: hypothetical protein OXP71_01160 [Candidatus Poribacteria bacterium]|nr:hypothetical protein [Candidatus Poribacteria bacterium]